MTTARKLTGKTKELKNSSGLYGIISKKGLTGNAINVSGDVEDKYGIIKKELHGDISDLKGDLSNIEGTISPCDMNKIDKNQLSNKLDTRRSTDDATPTQLINLVKNGLTGDVTNISGDVSLLVGDLSGVSTSDDKIETLKDDVSKIFGDIGTVYGDCSQICGEVTGLSGDLTDYTAKIGFMNKHSAKTSFERFLLTACLLTDN